MNIKDVKLKKGMSREEVNDLIGVWLTLENEVYVNAKHKHNWKCKCGNVFIRNWDHIKRRNSFLCIECGIKNRNKKGGKKSSRKLSREKVAEILNENGYELIGEYINNRTPIVMKCPSGHITDTMILSSFKKGCRCSVCSRKAKLTYDFVKSQFEKEGYIMISETYKNANTKLHVQCPNNHDWYVKYGHFYSGKRCGVCSNNKKLNYDFIKSEFEKEGYRLLSDEYINAKSKLNIICNFGHETHTMTWNNFKRGQRCSECNISKGEKRINTWLKINNIEFIPQKTFNGLIGTKGGNLSYDFYLPKYNLLIEYQGEFHDGNVPHQTQEDFNMQQEHDRRKREYAKENGIGLLEIWYWDFDNIEEILKNELNI